MRWTRLTGRASPQRHVAAHDCLEHIEGGYSVYIWPNLLLISRQTSVFDLLLPRGVAACASVLNGGSGDVCGPGNLANRLKLASIDLADHTRSLIHDLEQREGQLVERRKVY